MRPSPTTLLLLLLAGVARAAAPTTQPAMAATDPVRENGIDFQAVAQVRWTMPAAGEKSEIQLGLKVTNHTQKVVQINLFDTVHIVLKDPVGQSLPVGGGRDRTTYPDPLILAPGEAKTIGRNAGLEVLKPGDGLRLIGQDGTGGTWYFDGLRPGKYTLSFEYENTEQMVHNLPNRPAPHAIDLKAGPYWYGKARTAPASVAIVQATGAIERLVARLAANPLWQNGRAPMIKLPEHAPTEQVVSKVFEMTGFDQGRVTEYRIVESKRVQIQGGPGGQYTAAVVDTDLGQKIVLYRQGNDAGGWWSRVYDSDAPAEKIKAGFETALKKPGDKLAIIHEEDRTLFAIHSPSGIGGATIERNGERWPESVVVRLHLRGLEFLAVSNGKVKVSAASDGRIAREHLWLDGKEGPAMEQSNVHWLGIRAFDAVGEPATAVPLQEGWFEITIPKAILDEGRALKLEWIDFYRG